MGETREVETPKGTKTVPARLEHWRLTSPDQKLIFAASKCWGGEVEEWPNAPGGRQWQVTTETDTLEVLVPFPQDLEGTQFLELWSGGGRLRMCTGTEELLSAGPCLCNPDARECQLTTHLLVLLPQLPDVGAWELTTRGTNAASELAGTMRVLRTLHARSGFAEASLVIEQRVAKGSGETHNYVVPVLRLSYTLAEAGLGAGHARPVLPPAGVDPDTGEITSSPESPTGEGGEAAADEPEPGRTPAAATTDEPPPDEPARERETRRPGGAKGRGSGSSHRSPCLHTKGTDLIELTDGQRALRCSECKEIVEVLA